ncbi:hypothetical protein Pint_20335 [Pistacia integerrima]|uniref:Uncharacterized protein n=1 Tax=Pistacia integerrima TaxID=434235 RepID=A0ACC0XDH0_9ROSI|nr:hypothetical protein Pint_20335 [Pistacia integerrima]
MFSEDAMKSECNDSSIEYMSEESSESELPSAATILKGFLKRASEDPEVPKLKRKFKLYMEKYGTCLGFAYSLSVPKKKRSVIIVDKVTDSSKQDTRSVKWTQPVVFDMGSSSTLSSLEKDEGHEEQRKEKRRKVSSKKMTVAVQRQSVLEVEVEPPMPERFRAIVESMNGSDVRFVIQKELTQTDLKQQNNRLSLPKKQIKTDSFLTSEDKDILDAKANNEIKVLLFTPCEKKVEVTFKKWRMNSTFVYNIIGAWFKEVVDDANNRLKIGKIVRLWSFRIPDMLSQGSKLCFVLDNCD